MLDQRKNLDLQTLAFWPIFVSTKPPKSEAHFLQGGRCSNQGNTNDGSCAPPAFEGTMFLLFPKGIDRCPCRIFWDSWPYCFGGPSDFRKKERILEKASLKFCLGSVHV